MNKAWIAWPVVCSLLSILTTVSNASSLKYKTPPPTRHQSIIAAVTPTSVTVTNETLSDKGKVLNRTDRTFAVTKFTEITVNGQRATIADLKPGMKASVTIGTDTTKAARIVANG